MSSKFYDHKVALVADLIPYALNSREHSDDQVAQIAASIRAFGFTNPVLIDEANNLIAGHGRVMAARKLGMTEVPAIVVTGMDERKRRALIIADNKLALNASWDMEALLVEVRDLGGEFGELMGFSDDELLSMFEPASDEKIPEQQDLKATFEVAVECSDETEQETVFNLLMEKGYKCRILTM
jgi:ParB-like chromosome segregation protein Spo0J